MTTKSCDQLASCASRWSHYEHRIKYVSLATTWIYSFYHSDWVHWFAPFEGRSPLLPFSIISVGSSLIAFNLHKFNESRHDVRMHHPRSAVQGFVTETGWFINITKRRYCGDFLHGGRPFVDSQGVRFGMQLWAHVSGKIIGLLRKEFPLRKRIGNPT